MKQEIADSPRYVTGAVAPQKADGGSTEDQRCVTFIVDIAAEKLYRLRRTKAASQLPIFVPDDND